MRTTNLPIGRLMALDNHEMAEESKIQRFGSLHVDIWELLLN